MPRVGLTVYMPARFAGLVRLPKVSVPMVTGAKPALRAMALPADDPTGLYGSCQSWKSLSDNHRQGGAYAVSGDGVGQIQATVDVG